MNSLATLVKHKFLRDSMKNLEALVKVILGRMVNDFLPVDNLLIYHPYVIRSFS